MFVWWKKNVWKCDDFNVLIIYLKKWNINIWATVIGVHREFRLPWAQDPGNLQQKAGIHSINWVLTQNWTLLRIHFKKKGGNLPEILNVNGYALRRCRWYARMAYHELLQLVDLFPFPLGNIKKGNQIYRGLYDNNKIRVIFMWFMQ